MPNFTAWEIYFIFGTKSFWNEVIHTCFNVEYVLLGCNFDFLGSYLEVTARYLMVTGRYCSLPGATVHYHSLMLVSTFSMNILLLILPINHDFTEDINFQ